MPENGDVSECYTGTELHNGSFQVSNDGILLFVLDVIFLQERFFLSLLFQRFCLAGQNRLLLSSLAKLNKRVMNAI